MFLDANGEADPFKSRYSGLAIGVPGTVAGLELAWRKHGSGKLSFADLVAPAAQLAHQGLTVDDDVADSLPLGQKQLALHPSAARIYLRPALSPRVAGDSYSDAGAMTVIGTPLACADAIVPMLE